MSVWVGTSGFSYKEWKKNFYPSDLPADQFLSHYATRLNGVEIDATFYRMPTPKSLENWRDSTPENFRFAIKASQQITHRQRLTVPSDALVYFHSLLPTLGTKLGIVLYQLPPNFKFNLPRLEAFLGALPAGPRSAFEFRNVSWFVDETFRLLEKHGVALCINDTEEFDCPVELTAKYTYVRFTTGRIRPRAPSHMEATPLGLRKERHRRVCIHQTQGQPRCAADCCRFRRRPRHAVE